jgi:group II intron reverse transcriptase/maturase
MNVYKKQTTSHFYQERRQIELLIGGTGEPDKTCRGRRARSTCLPEREPVMVKREGAEAHSTEGKGPKSVMGESSPLTAYLNDFQRRIRESNDSKQTMQGLKTLWEASARGRKVQRLWRLMGDINLWVAAYEKLAGNRGSMTKGGVSNSKNGTIDGTSMKTIEELRRLVTRQTYKPGLGRRVSIRKPQGGQRNLPIPEFRDRMVQEMTRTLMEIVYEPRFSQYSHGFRPNRSQHTCLRQVRRDFSGTKWFIEGDISECFDKIKHSRVRKCLERAIDDKKFVNFVIDTMKSKMLMPDKTVTPICPSLGCPQGGISSPIISNIVLGELDKGMHRIIKKLNKGKVRKKNKEYNKLYEQMRQKPEQKHRLLGKLPRKVGARDQMDSTFVRVSYTRYAHDFLIGVIGSRALAQRIKDTISRILRDRIGLELNAHKTQITRAKNNKVAFLGYLIGQFPSRAYTYFRKYGGRIKKVTSHREGNLMLKVDRKRVVNQLAAKGFCHGGGFPLPNFRYLSHPESYTIAQVNYTLRGLCNYYKLSEGLRPFINRINYIMRYSTAKLFAAKFRKKSITSIFKVAGKSLSKPIKPKPLKRVVSPLVFGTRGAKISRKQKGILGSTDQKSMHDAKEAGSQTELKSVGIVFSEYKLIPKPDLKPLPRSWKPWVSFSKKESHLVYPLAPLGGLSLRG